MFAKLYDHPTGEQVLVVLGSGDEGPEVRISTKPPGLGICDFKIGWNNDESGMVLAKAYFQAMNRDVAVQMASTAIDEAINLTAGNP